MITKEELEVFQKVKNMFIEKCMHKNIENGCCSECALLEICGIHPMDWDLSKVKEEL